MYQRDRYYNKYLLIKNKKALDHCNLMANVTNLVNSVLPYI